jgi:hypothetical protein
MWSYTLYGERVSSGVQLEGVREVSANDFSTSICMRTDLAAPGDWVDDGNHRFDIRSGEWWFDYPDSAIYRLTPGEIAFRPHASSSSRPIRECIQGRLLGLYFRQSGHVVLHANVVSRGGRALLLLGMSGAGKTTLTSALLTRGFGFLSDDLAVLEVGDAAPRVFPGPGRLKVRRTLATGSKSVESGALDKDVQTLEVENLALPVHALVIVEPESPWSEVSMVPSEALLQLVRHAHMPRSLKVTGSSVSHMSGAARLVDQVECVRLRRGEGPGDIERSADYFEAVMDSRESP